MIIYLSLLVCIGGALLFGFATNPKLVDIGRMMFWTGLLAFLLTDQQLMQLLPHGKG